MKADSMLYVQRHCSVCNNECGRPHLSCSAGHLLTYVAHTTSAGTSVSRLPRVVLPRPPPQRSQRGVPCLAC